MWSDRLMALAVLGLVAIGLYYLLMPKQTVWSRLRGAFSIVIGILISLPVIVHPERLVVPMGKIEARTYPLGDGYRIGMESERGEKNFRIGTFHFHAIAEKLNEVAAKGRIVKIKPFEDAGHVTAIDVILETK